jgi:hypothetical protein
MLIDDGEGSAPGPAADEARGVADPLIPGKSALSWGWAGGRRGRRGKRSDGDRGEGAG